MPIPYWLPAVEDCRKRIAALRRASSGDEHDLTALIGGRLDFIQTNTLDALLRQKFGDRPGRDGLTPVRLALLASCTMAHLQPAIRIAGLRRGLAIAIHEATYGQYFQALARPDPALLAFAPTVLLLALDAHTLAAEVTAGMDEASADAALEAALAQIAALWQRARTVFRCHVVHQLPLPVHPPLIGGNEHRLAGSASWFISRLCMRLRTMADKHGVDILALDLQAQRYGIDALHDRRLWHGAKQEVAPAAAPLHGELVARLLAAIMGRSAKCVVVDLDNTLWAGVVGDDGVDGLAIGPGSTAGEAHLALQRYLRELSGRGILISVCSKNDERTAWRPFDERPEMVLRRDDIACFVANWSDKATNIREIARRLNIGLDALVFVDDNPAERHLVRRALPMVAVPELGEDPSDFVATITDAGYFETVSVTAEDLQRVSQYNAERRRQELAETAVDLDGYLRELGMTMRWTRFKAPDLPRIVQLIHKTNQFNLTTRRHSRDEVAALVANPACVTLQIRLADKFGDAGLIAVVIAHLHGVDEMLIDIWLMSCRVLGRGVETATLTVLVNEARRAGAASLIGEYVPTAKNGLVRDHYATLGFRLVAGEPDGPTFYRLDLGAFLPTATAIDIREG